MFTKFKDYFKKSPEPDLTPETQEEIDKNLLHAVQYNDYWQFWDAIKKGANVNQMASGNYTILMKVSNSISSKSKLKMVEELIKNGADVYHILRDDFDFLDWANKITRKEESQKILKMILKYHPDFYEERELRKNANKYNL
jgi:hypothetical protein